LESIEKDLKLSWRNLIFIMALMVKTAVKNRTLNLPRNQDSRSRWQRVQKIRKSADTEPDGRGFGFEFVPAGADAGTTLNPTDIC